MQPAWAARLLGLSGVAGRDRREKPVLPGRGEEEGTFGKQRPRGRENEEGFGVSNTVSDPDDTPEDVEDDDEPEFCQSIN